MESCHQSDREVESLFWAARKSGDNGGAGKKLRNETVAQNSCGANKIVAQFLVITSSYRDRVSLTFTTYNNSSLKTRY